MTATQGRGLAKGPDEAQKLPSIPENAIVSFALAYALAAALPADPMGLRTAAMVAAQPRAFQLLARLGLRSRLFGSSPSFFAALGVLSGSELVDLALLAVALEIRGIGVGAGATLPDWTWARAAIIRSNLSSVVLAAAAAATAAGACAVCPSREERPDAMT